MTVNKHAFFHGVTAVTKPSQFHNTYLIITRDWLLNKVKKTFGYNAIRSLGHSFILRLAVWHFRVEDDSANLHDIPRSEELKVHQA